MATVEGLSEVIKNLAEVEKKIRKKTLRKMATGGGKIVLTQVKANVRRVSGLLARSLGHKTKSFGGVTFTDIIGARKGYDTVIKGRKVDPSKYASLVEKGTAPHSVARGSKLARRGRAASGQTGKMHPGAKAQPFIGPAKESTRTRVMDRMAEIATEAMATIGGG